MSFTHKHFYLGFEDGSIFSFKSSNLEKVSNFPESDWRNFNTKGEKFVDNKDLLSVNDIKVEKVYLASSHADGTINIY